MEPEVFNWDETMKLVALPDITINLWESLHVRGRKRMGRSKEERATAR